MDRRIGFVIAAVVGLVIGFTVGALRSAPPPPPPQAPPPRLVPPLHDAQVGEWLKIENGPDAQVYRIIGATDFDVEVEMTQLHDGAPIASPGRVTWHRNSFSLPSDCVIRAIDRDRVEIGGKRYDCWQVAVFRHDRNYVYWVSDEIPVHGVLKVAPVGKDGPDDLHAVRLVECGFEPN